MKVTNDESSLSEIHAGASSSTDDNLDDLIYIMDSCYVTDNGYHEIAQRYPSLARYRVIKRRHELNQQFNIKEIQGRFEGVYKSVTEHLTYIFLT